jgi:hypothetical protein
LFVGCQHRVCVEMDADFAPLDSLRRWRLSQQSAAQMDESHARRPNVLLGRAQNEAKHSISLTAALSGMALKLITRALQNYI